MFTYEISGLNVPVTLSAQVTSAPATTTTVTTTSSVTTVSGTWTTYDPLWNPIVVTGGSTTIHSSDFSHHFIIDFGAGKEQTPGSFVFVTSSGKKYRSDAKDASIFCKPGTVVGNKCGMTSTDVKLPNEAFTEGGWLFWSNGETVSNSLAINSPSGSPPSATDIASAALGSTTSVATFTLVSNVWKLNGQDFIGQDVNKIALITIPATSRNQDGTLNVAPINFQDSSKNGIINLNIGNSNLLLKASSYAAGSTGNFVLIDQNGNTYTSTAYQKSGDWEFYQIPIQGTTYVGYVYSGSSFTINLASPPAETCIFLSNGNKVCTSTNGVSGNHPKTLTAKVYDASGNQIASLQFFSNPNQPPILTAVSTVSGTAFSQQNTQLTISTFTPSTAPTSTTTTTQQPTTQQATIEFTTFVEKSLNSKVETVISSDDLRSILLRNPNLNLIVSESWLTTKTGKTIQYPPGSNFGVLTYDSKKLASGDSNFLTTGTGPKLIVVNNIVPEWKPCERTTEICNSVSETCDDWSNKEKDCGQRTCTDNCGKERQDKKTCEETKTTTGSKVVALENQCTETSNENEKAIETCTQTNTDGTTTTTTKVVDKSKCKPDYEWSPLEPDKCTKSNQVLISRGQDKNGCFPPQTKVIECPDCDVACPACVKKPEKKNEDVKGCWVPALGDPVKLRCSSPDTSNTNVIPKKPFYIKPQNQFADPLSEFSGYSNANNPSNTRSKYLIENSDDNREPLVCVYNPKPESEYADSATGSVNLASSEKPNSGATGLIAGDLTGFSVAESKVESNFCASKYLDNVNYPPLKWRASN